MATGGEMSLELGGALVNGEEGEERLDHTEIERELDILTLSGSAVNELEFKLIRTREIYRRTLEECRQRLATTRRRLQTHIVKSEPFVDVWRRARQVQEASNRAAARFDKANSQYTAAKEMITVAEEKLSVVVKEPSSPSALDLAWQEMLNHATARVTGTERERRDSEQEHKQVLEECQAVMEEYKNTERRLRSHITKSRPFYEQRYECNRRLQQIKRVIVELESKIRNSKDTYSRTLKKLETLNTQIHERRRSSSVLMLKAKQRMAKEGVAEDRKRSSSALSLVTMKGPLVCEGKERRAASANSTPEMRKKNMRNQSNGLSDAASLESLQLGDMHGQFTGSTGSLPSIGTSSVSDYCPTPDTREERQDTGPPRASGETVTMVTDQPSAPEIKILPPVQEEELLAQDLVAEVLQRAAAKLRESEISPTPEDPYDTTEGVNQ